MEQNTDQSKLLAALYQENLTENIQLKEERVMQRLRIEELEAKVAELEANQKCESCPVAEAEAVNESA